MSFWLEHFWLSLSAAATGGASLMWLASRSPRKAAETASEVEGLRSSLSDWAQKYASLEKGHGDLYGRLASLTSEHQTALAAAGTLEARIEALQQELAALHAVPGELGTLRTQLAAAQHAASQHARQLQQVAQERDHYSARLREQAVPAKAMSATAG
ncbi:MAG: hypothetical protein K2X03_21320 [Bryobacteraceae bacterium]|nr:hypothetical protein [Bryobacteraceae bacterium]